MPGTIVGYTESQDARIARAVLEVERQKRSLILPRRRGMRRQRRRIIPFSGACMIDAANPDAQNPNNAVMSVVRKVIGSGAPDAATDQQLLVKLAYPMTTQAANAFILSKSTTTTWKTRGPATPYNSQLNCIVHWAFITADFEYEGASCASWNTKPATSALSYLENVGTSCSRCADAGVDASHVRPDVNDHQWQPAGADIGITVYGVNIYVTWFSDVGGFNQLRHGQHDHTVSVANSFVRKS